MWSIRETANGWEVVSPDGSVLSSHPRYEMALAALGEAVRAQLAETDNDPGDGLLPERWGDSAGIFFSEETGDGRDFTSCQWGWRDPGESLLPLMLQTETEIGHFGAQLAGFIESIGATSGTGHASGRFYASDTGRAARDLLLGGRTFGVSVDPGAVTAEWECVEEDEDGWCIQERISFLAYEVIGLTMTPFPAFARASIGLVGDSDDEAPAEESTAVLAAVPTLSIPAAPPGAWFEIPEPEPTMRGMLDVYGMPVEELLVEQPDGAMAVPLVITDDGRVFGHAARWGQCHVGFPGACVSPPESAAAYAHFHVGEVRTAEGGRVATGVLTAGCDHAATSLRAVEAQDHYAHNGVGWADVRARNGALGVWVCGALRPDVTPEQVRILRASSLSGDWRRLGGNLELVAALAVNVPGFPIAREAVTAAGLVQLASATTRGAVDGSEPTALVASGIVHRCGECARRRASDPTPGGLRTGTLRSDGETEALRAVGATLAILERRTRHLIAPAREDLARRIRR